jgi:hypothetical protein
MSVISIEQAVYRRDDGAAPHLIGYSPGFADAWLPLAEALVVGFGDRPAGVACGGAVFARPLGRDRVAVVQVADQGPAALGFRVLAVPRQEYTQLLGDPFAVADRFPPAWNEAPPLLALTMPAEPLPPRTVEDVQNVLQRVKAHALREGEDPQAAAVTVDNAESPALLGGVQVLVDGGRVVFERPAPDTGLMRGLWTLLPTRSRGELWPASFAFGNALGFDALIVPRAEGEQYAGYTDEEQAADYPPGSYELNLQTAAEAGDQRELDVLLGRRTWKDTWRLGLALFAVLLGVLLFLRLTEPPSRERAEKLGEPPSRERAEKLGLAAGVVGVGDPISALSLIQVGNAKYAKPGGSR